MKKPRLFRVYFAEQEPLEIIIYEDSEVYEGSMHDIFSYFKFDRFANRKVLAMDEVIYQSIHKIDNKTIINY